MDKRGVLQLYYLFEVVVAALVVFMMFSFAKNAATGEDVQRNFLTKDSALMIDTLHAVPGDLNFNYETYNFTQDLSMSILPENVVQLKPPFGAFDLFPFRAGSFKIINEEFTIESNKTNTLEFVKNGPEILFGKELEYSKKIKCPVVNTKADIKSKKIVIDPRHGGEEKGTVFENIHESDVNRMIAFLLFKLLGNAEKTRSLTEDEEKSIEERISIAKNADLLVSIGFSDTEDNSLNIYIPRNIESRKLACLMINNLEKYRFDSSKIMISDNPLLSAKASVFIELGSLSKESHDNMAKYADGIYNAIKNYYE